MRRAILRAAAVLVGPVILHLPVYEFVKLHRLSERELRDRFDLPGDCDPMLTAGASRHSEVIVVITCRGDEDAEAGAREVRMSRP